MLTIIKQIHDQLKDTLYQLTHTHNVKYHYTIAFKPRIQQVVYSTPYNVAYHELYNKFCDSSSTEEASIICYDNSFEKELYMYIVPIDLSENNINQYLAVISNYQLEQIYIYHVIHSAIHLIHESSFHTYWGNLLDDFYYGFFIKRSWMYPGQDSISPVLGY